MDPQAPPVVAVVVTADPGAWLEESLGGLAAQDYPNLSVLVIDAGSAEDPTPRIAQVLPGAFVRRLEVPTGYAAAANEAITAVEGASFFLMCHDDVCLDPDAVRLLVEEAFRSNAGVVAPKLVAWEDSSRLLQVGMSADKAGVPVPSALPGELDQEQHDGVRDVFCAPGAATLIRVDLFRALGGFDPEMVLFGEDLDLSWRAQVAGARVLVAPSARARHLAAASSGMRQLQELPGVPPGPSRQLLLRRRHELRSALKCYGRWHLLRVLPQLVAHSTAEVAVGVVTGHPAAARASAAAWTWNLKRHKDLRRMRSAVRERRALTDGEVRRLQTAGSARLGALAEGMFARASSHVPHREEGHAGAAIGQTRPWWPTAVWTVIAVFLLAGSRGFVHSGPSALGTMLPFGSWTHLLGSYASSVRPGGAGAVSPAPLALALAAVASTILLGATGLARSLLVVGMLPLGALGAYRLARGLGSRRARLVAPVVYLALPLPYDGLSAGRWGEVVAFGAAPWLLDLMAGAAGLEPFTGPSSPAAGGGQSSPAAGGGQRGTAAGGGYRETAGHRRRTLTLALLLAVAGAFAPGLALVALIAAVGMVLGSLFTGGRAAALRGLASTLAGVIGAWLLAFPWSVVLVSPSATVANVLGVRPVPARTAGVGALLGFHAAPGGTDWVGWALLAGMAVPLFFGREWRLGWGARLWSVAAVCWAAAWAGQRGWLGGWTIDPGVLLAVTGAALALSACLGVVAFETDLVGYGLGWRQALSVVGVIGVGLGVAGAVGHIGDGRWGAPSAGFDSVLGSLPGHNATGGFQELWVGDPEAIPGGGWELTRGVAYTVSAGGGVPDVEYDWPPPQPPPTASAAAGAIQSAESGRTGLVGRELARLGVRYVLVPTEDAPSGLSVAPPPRLVAALDNQLDLRPVAVDPSLLVYENADWHPSSGAPEPAAQGGERAAQLAFEALLWAGTLGALWVTRTRFRRGAVQSQSSVTGSPARPVEADL